MLIYPRVDRLLREQYEILGRKISVCTVSLDAPWWAIDREINELKAPTPVRLRDKGSRFCLGVVLQSKGLRPEFLQL
jgi:hypothetical protein